MSRTWSDRAAIGGCDIGRQITVQQNVQITCNDEKEGSSRDEVKPCKDKHDITRRLITLDDRQSKTKHMDELHTWRRLDRTSNLP